MLMIALVDLAEYCSTIQQYFDYNFIVAVRFLLKSAEKN